MIEKYLECLDCGLEWDYGDFYEANPDTCPTCGGRLHDVEEEL
jgi:hypothetical protein